MTSIRAGVATLIAAYREWRDDRAVRLGAGLAYYALFAAIPIVTIAVAMAGILFSQAEIESFVAERVESLLGGRVPSAAPELAREIDASTTFTSLGVMGVATLVVAASVFFVAVQDAFNILWGVPKQRGMAMSLRRRLTGVVLVFLVGGFLGATLLVGSLASAINEILPGDSPVADAFDTLLASLGSAAVGIGTLVLLFKLLIREEVAWRHLAVGCAVTDVLLVLGTWGFAIYLATFASFSLSGVAGALLAMLVWMYLMAQILLYGAELVKVLSRSR